MNIDRSKIKYFFQLFLSLPKILYSNFRAFPFKIAVKLPLFISFGTKISGIKRGKIILESNITTGMISIGFWGTEGVVSNGYTQLRIGRTGCWHIRGKTIIGQGCSICLGGVLISGANFGVNKNSMVSCNKMIYIGENVTTGWNVDIRDSDNHSIYCQGSKKESEKNIVIGNHVWVCANVKILKGVIICDDSVIAYNSCVTKQFDKGNILIGGYPAKVLQENIDWKL